MRVKVIIGCIGVVLAFATLYFFLLLRDMARPKSTSNPVMQDTSQMEDNLPKKRTESDLNSEKNRPKEEVTIKSVWKLDSSNFEFRVQKCFQGEACEFDEDPLALYRFFKKSGNSKAIDLLISYLRKDLKDPKFAALYKKPLKAMIDDFYPSEEKQFQEAAYYNYLGELDKSLELYLDLEKKAAKDSRLRKAPKVNIANTYYDLGKLREALPYYEAALERNSKPDMRGPGQDDVIRFIERRIEEIKAKLRP